MPETEFKGVTSFGYDVPNKLIKTSLIDFFNWGFLQIGAFVNVKSGDTRLYSGNPSILRAVKDPNYTDGKVWEGFRRNWVWESGLNYTKVNFSGIYINGTFYPDNGTTYKVNYPLGRILFNSPRSLTDTIQAEYSYKWVTVSDADQIPFFQQLQDGGLDISHPGFLQFASGDWFKIGQTRVQPPLLAVEMPKRVSAYPAQLGGGTWITKNILCHIVSEDGGDTADKIADILTMQKENIIYGVDYNRLAQDRRFPLDSNGSIASGALTYPQMTIPQASGGYQWRKMYITDTSITNRQRLSEKLHISTVDVKLEVLLGIL